MDEKKKTRIIFIFTLIYVLYFLVISIYRSNYEFIFYILFQSSMILGTIAFHKKVHLPFYTLILLSILGIFHFVGGGFAVGGIRIYDLTFLNGIIRYDNIMHLFGTSIFVFIGYNLLYPHLDSRVKHNPFLLAFILILIATGFGALNEIIELIGVAFFKAADGIGTYINNALDLVYNTIGAILASIIVVRYHRKLIASQNGPAKGLAGLVLDEVSKRIKKR